MKFFRKKDEPQEPQPDDGPTLEWLEPSANLWGARLLDLRPITQGMLSTSQDRQMALNAISYKSDDGLSFVNQAPESSQEITADITFNIDRLLAPGVLFAPDTMEHKWAIFFHQNRIIFVRSWLRKVAVTADAYQENGRLHINKIKGRFADDHPPEFTRAIVKFLLISHAIGEVFPAPLPNNLMSETKSAGLWAMSLYGKLAPVGTFETNFNATTQTPIRSHSLLHIAVAKGDLNQIDVQLHNGIPIDLLAKDGLAPLHWSLAQEGGHAMDRLLELGADPDIRSIEGATPIMNAAQTNRTFHLELLLSAGADVNARDNRGFTALHRASEIGRLEAVKILLQHGASPHTEAQGYTPLALAEMREEKEIARLLQEKM